MSVIEGIGDEVVQFFSVVFIVILGLAAWWSTSIRDSHHNIRTVLILERRSRNRHVRFETPQPQVNVTDVNNAIDTGQQDPADEVETELLTDDSQDKDESETSNTVEGQTTTQSTEGEEVLLNVTETTTDTQEACASQQNLRKKAQSFLKAQAATLLSESSQDSVSAAESQPVREDDQIRIRLKYLNDDQKLVEGRLQEQLGEFKRRHFSIELSADKLVRLIFNGQVLGSDQQTLQACGLYDNCVVHCLVHTQRTPVRSSVTPHSSSNNPASPPDWNLSALLYTCLSLVLCLIWYCRYQYSQLFTLTTTAALIGLTGIFTVSVFSFYLPDQDGIPH